MRAHDSFRLWASEVLARTTIPCTWRYSWTIRSFSRNLSATVEMLAGLRADTAQLFSVTNAVPQAIDAELYAEVMRNALAREAKSLAGYPGIKGHERLHGLIAAELKDRRGADVDIEDIFPSDGTDGAIRKLVEAFIDAGGHCAGCAGAAIGARLARIAGLRSFWRRVRWTGIP